MIIDKGDVMVVFNENKIENISFLTEYIKTCDEGSCKSITGIMNNKHVNLARITYMRFVNGKFDNWCTSTKPTESGYYNRDTKLINVRQLMRIVPDELFEM